MKYKTAGKRSYRFIATRCFVLAAALFLAAVPTTANAAPGHLDPTFGTGGRILPLGAPTVSEAFGVATQPDNKILVAGVEQDFLSWPPSGSHRLVLTRYMPNGSLDLTFGQGGRVLTSISPNCHSYGDDLVLQPDGKVVLIGHQDGCGTESGVYVFRYMPDGSFDPTFDGDGKLRILSGIPGLSFYTTSCRAAVQSGGKLVLSCGEWMWEEDYWKVILRLNPDGSPDTSFGGGIGGPGRVYLDTSDFSPLDIAIQPDGKIVGAGEYDRTAGKSVGLVRLNTDGSYDGSFGNSGWVFTSGGGSALDERALAIQPDNKIVVAGNWLSQNTVRGLVIRYLPNGSLDTSFGASGINFSGSPNHSYSSIAIQSNGKILVGSGYSGYHITRFLGSGVLDPAFGISGQVSTEFPGLFPATSLNGWVGDLAIQRDGRIISAGGWQGHEGWPDVQLSFRYQAIARHIGDSKAAYDFDGDGRTDVSVFRPSEGKWYLNRSTDGINVVNWGVAGDKITPADFDGDGKTDTAVFRPSNGSWYVINSATNTFAIQQWGTLGDTPLPGDFDGDGRADRAVFRQWEGDYGDWHFEWYVLKSSGGIWESQFGYETGIPVPQDYDGDGFTDRAFYEFGTWQIPKNDGSIRTHHWGLSDDIAVPADYDGDGKADIAVWRPSDGKWYIRKSGSNLAIDIFEWGINGDVPVPGDYDGDGRTDPAVYRNGVWYLLQTTAGISIRNWGLSDDRPVPSAFLQ